MQPDRGMMWQAENPELAREFPAGTASKARQSRLHQAQGFFPVFVFHSFVQFLNINVSKITRASLSNRLLPADTVEHALRGALFQYAQVAELATHARYLHALQRTRGFALQGLEDFGGGQPLRSL